jgi:hypothetical protein
VDYDDAAGMLVRGRFAAVVCERAVPEAGPMVLLQKPIDVEEVVHRVRVSVGAIDLRSLQRFVNSIPALRAALSGPAPQAYELALRVEMRRTLLELSDTLHAAAQAERNRTRAATFLAASAAAAELAAGRIPVPQSGDH